MSRFWWRRIAYGLTILHIAISVIVILGIYHGNVIPPGVQKAFAYGNIGTQMAFLAILILSRKST